MSVPPSLRRLVALSAALLLAVSVLAVLPGARPAAADPRDLLGPLFEPLEDHRVPSGERVRVRPSEFSAFEVDLPGLRSELATAPAPGEARRGAEPLVVSVPDPAGRLVRFAVEGTALMEPALAAAHPELRTYAGRGLDDPTLSVALDVTPMGFHASVRRPGSGESWLVDPQLDERGTATHLSYHGHDAEQPAEPFDFRPPLPELGPDRGPAAGRDAARTAPGERVSLRTYRLALVTDPSYAAYFGTDNVLAEKVTLMTRVNQVYNDDLGITMVLVDGTDALNLDTVEEAAGADGPCGASACYTKAQLAGCSSGLLTRNTFVLGQLIGADAYDIGHIALGLNGGGIAGLGVVGEQRKAAGCTGLPKPQGDFFAIDYVAHEMGHQFNGNHTFNGSEGNCSLTNRNPGTSVEPGSGSSVMAYAGICAHDDLQPHTDPYFSQRSLEEVDEHVTAAPIVYDEQQTITLRGFDAADDVIRLTFPNREPVTIANSPLEYNALAVQEKIFALTGYRPTVEGYDGALVPDAGGFSLSFDLPVLGGTGADIPRIGVENAGGDVSGFTGVQVEGGAGGNQGASTLTANHAPAVTAPGDRTVPARTPFTLTGSGTDLDGDPLLYLWEQNDEGVDQVVGDPLLANAKTDGPLFRVFGTAADVSDEAALQSPSPGQNNATGSPSRTFPDLAQVLAGNTNAATGACPEPPADAAAPVPADVVECFSEYLPTADYAGEMNFRLTARDQRTGGGGTAFDDVVLTVATGAGPFLLTSQGADDGVRRAGDVETVTWAVNGTDAPEMAPDVRITMSEDGGQTFPRQLVAPTPNDGSADIIWPEVFSERVRLRIEAVDNYFFDVNDADLTVSGPLSATTGTTAAAAQFSDGPAAPVEVTATTGAYDADQLTATVQGVEGVTAQRTSATDDGTRPATASFALVGPVTADPGTYTATVTVSEPQPAGVADTVLIPFTVTPEGAVLDYTGPAAVSSDESSTATLRASVADVADGSPGDVTLSDLAFVDRASAPDTVLCTAPVTGTAGSGTASCTADLGEVGSRSIGLVLTGPHARDEAADDAAVVVTAPAEPEEPSEPTEPADTTAPQTTVTGGPHTGALVADRSVRFRYAADEPATYACRIDGRAVGCGEGSVVLRRLRAGMHEFTVAARDEAGNLDATPEVRRFAVAFDDRQLRRSGPWQLRSGSRHYRSTYLAVERKGARVALDVSRARRVGVVVATGRGHGRVVVRIGSRVIGRVDLGGRARTRVLRVLPELDEPLSGRLTVRTRSGRQVRVDGLAVYRD